MAVLTAEDLTRWHELSEQLRAELRASVKPQADELVLQLDRTCAAEQAWTADPDRDDLMDAAKAERSKLDKARSDFDKAVSSAKAVRTRKLDEALKLK
jgi:hypothetical protein